MLTIADMPIFNPFITSDRSYTCGSDLILEISARLAVA